MPIPLVLFEDNHDLRNTLVRLLEASGTYQVMGDFANATRVKEAIQELQPQVVVLDINLPGMSGIDAIPIIKEMNPEVFVVMYTQFEEDEKLFQSLCAGADGYILKKTSPLKLVDAIDEVCNGGTPLSPAIAKKILHSFRQPARGQSKHFRLTPKETAILQLLIKGYSVKLIASEENITYDTCRSHLRNIYRKLHVNCGKEAIAKILAEKIIL